MKTHDLIKTIKRILRFVFAPWLLAARLQKSANDYKAVADDYFDALHFLDEYSLYHSLSAIER